MLTNLTSLVGAIGGIVDQLIPIAFAAALLFFFWGMAMYIRGASDEEKAQGRSIMVWGVVALFVMASVWGIVLFIGSALGINQGGAVPTPGVNDTTTDFTVPVNS